MASLLEQMDKKQTFGRMTCETDLGKIDCFIDTTEAKYFYDSIEDNKGERAGAIVFNNKGKMIMFNMYLGGKIEETVLHNHFLSYHTHTRLLGSKKYSAPSCMDYITIIVQHCFGGNDAHLIFEREGCWVIRFDKNVIKRIKEKIKKFINKNSKTFNEQDLINFMKSEDGEVLRTIKILTNEYKIRLDQPPEILNKKKENILIYTPIGLQQYIELVRDNIGANVTFFNKKEIIMIPQLQQCIESRTSLAKICDIDPKILSKHMFG
jgi:hypothetical protein